MTDTGESKQSSPGPSSPGASAWDPQDQLDGWLKDIHLMKSYATADGMVIPPSAVRKLADLTRDVRKLEAGAVEAGAVLALALEVHSAFCALVAPATPRSLRETQKNGTVSPWRNGLVIFMFCSAIFAIVLFVLAANIYPNKPTVMWFAAAVLGASFYSLFTAHKYILARTFDPQYQTLYVIRFVLGVVSGIVLAHFGKKLIPQNSDLGGSLFGLIGGYSSEAVNQILLRVSDTLVTAVKGSGEDQSRSKEQELKSTRLQAAAEKDAERAALSDELDALLSATTPSTPSQEILDRIKKLKKRIDGR